MRIRLALVSALFVVGLVAGCAPARQAGPAAVITPAPATPPVALPNQNGSLKIAVLGDFGTGERPQFELAEQMIKFHQTFPYEVVLLVGDNMYGAERPPDYQEKFEIPYRLLLDREVKFYASLGNHDDRNQRFYKPFNMEGKHYHSFKGPKQSVKFVAMESTYPTPEQLKWVEHELEQSREEWKIPYFHHPLYSSGGRHGSDYRLREAVEPIFVRHNVSVVFQGHDHFYERIKPQKGIPYFVVGSGGKLRAGDIDDRSPLTAKGFDSDLVFVAAEIVGDQMYFNAISRSGRVIDSGIILRRQPAAQ